MGDKSKLEEWIKYLDRYYSKASIRRYYYKYKGETKNLSDLYSSKVLSRGRDIKSKIRFRKMGRVVSTFTDYPYPKTAYAKKRPTSKRGTIVISMVDVNFDKFFDKVYFYFTDKAINDKTFSKLEIILKNYYDTYIKTQVLMTISSKDSISDKEEDIKRKLKQVNKILRIIESQFYNLIPKEVKIETLAELNNKTILELKKLELRPSYTYAKLLEDLRKI